MRTLACKSSTPIVDSAIPTNFTKQRAGKITVGMSIPPDFGGIKLANKSWTGTKILVSVALAFVIAGFVFLGCGDPGGPTERGSLTFNTIGRDPVFSLTDTTLNGFQVHYTGRTFDGSNTTFSYVVSGPSVDMHFRLGYPGETCSSPPQSWFPTNGATSNNDCCINPGLEWHPSVGSDSMNTFEFSYAFAGDVPEGIVAVSVKNESTVEVGSISGPGALFIISGSLFQDADEDGALDATETFISNVTINLKQSGNVVESTVTGIDGTYQFLIPCGSYDVEADTSTLTNTQGKYFTSTTPISLSVTVGPDSPGNNFGFKTNTTKLIEDLGNGTLTTTGFTATFWKKQVQSAINNKRATYTRTQVLGFITVIEGLALPDPYIFPSDDNGRLQTAFDILKMPVHTDLETLVRELLALEFNYAASRGIDPSTQLVLIGWGESLVAQEGAANPGGKFGLTEGVTPIGDAIEIFQQIDKSTGGGGTR